MTDIGSGFLTKETSILVYLFRNRITRIKKSHLWHMIDCGAIRVKYVDSKKYRRIQKRYRTLDTRGIPIADIGEELMSFKFC